jgi:hypothetical protein
MNLVLIMGTAALITGAQAEGSHTWNSPQECYNAHIRLADGWYPLPSQGDDPRALMKHCEYEFKAKRCNFTCEVQRVSWEVAVLYVPAHQHAANLRRYFKQAERARSFLLNI